MKKMESKIALTFVIVFVVGIIINGLYNVISMNASFFSFEVLVIAMLSALVYMLYIWIFTRRHKTLALIGVSSSGLLFLLLGCSFNDVALSFESIATSFGTWRDIVMIIYFAIVSFIAEYQAKKLLKEDKMNFEGDIKPEDVKVSID